MNWIDCKTQLPPDGQIVNSKLNGAKGERNEQTLKRQGNLWFVPDGSMYVYYRPTHWAELADGGRAELEAIARKTMDDARRKVESLGLKLPAIPVAGVG